MNRVHPFGSEGTPRRLDKFSLVLLVEAAFVVLYGIFVEYDSSADSNSGAQDDAVVREYYAMYQDVHVMIFVGFGFLMAFLRLYGYSAISFTLLLGSIAIQWSILVAGFWNQLFSLDFHKISISVPSFINADFAAAAFLISFGGIIGKVTPFQLIIMVLIEVALYALNNEILVSRLQVADVGGSITIHVFGAYFGLATAMVLGKRPHANNKDNSSVYHSNLFSLIGTIFLWLYWPSFNAALGGASNNSRQRSVINTLMSITASSIVTFATSKIFRKGRFDIVDIQNATLAGGVAMGASAFMRTTPYGAMVVGLIAGVVSTGGFAYLQPKLADTIALYDTCGIHNLHGMPGIIGGLASAVFASLAGTADFMALGSSDPAADTTLTDVFPGRSTRSASEQATYQLAGLGVTLGIAIVGGIATGFILRLFPQDTDNDFSDKPYWHVPEEETPEYFAAATTSGSKRAEKSTRALI